MSRLAEYFEGVAVKRLSAVEADTATSNQHEFNGIRSMAALFGTDRIQMDANFLYLGEDEEATLAADGFLTWYDARERHPRRTEYRLYFPSNEVMEMASTGDLLVVAKKADGTVLLLVIRAGSTYERQILWLFGITGETGIFSTETIEGDRDRELGFAERTILETLGIETVIEEPGWLDRILERFGAVFPKTSLFSAFARETLPDISSTDNPDIALSAWIDQEEMLFRTLEKHIVEQRLEAGFNDVDVFISYSLSVQNRRKSRMGFALENHLRQVFSDHNLAFSRQVITEQNSKPDFLFPGISQYRDDNFPPERLTLLGAKSSCKERWNQVLAEANRITQKHLFTLEPGISPNQTNKMQEKNLQLVLPQALHQTYDDHQQAWLMNLSSFIELVRQRQ